MGDKKVAVVTGGVKGIGRAISEELLSRGIEVLVLDIIDDERADWIEQTENVSFYKCDVTDRPLLDEVTAQIKEKYGTIDYLVNDAGYLTPGRQDFIDYEDDEWDKTMDVDATGVFNCLKRFGRVMIEGGKPGAVVNIASIAGLNPIPRSGAYCPAKAAVVSLTKVTAIEWGKYGIRVNAICPGQILTDINRARIEGPENVEVKKQREAAVPLGRIGDVTNIAKTCAFLLSDDACYTTGETHLVDGGITLEGIAVCGRS